MCVTCLSCVLLAASRNQETKASVTPFIMSTLCCAMVVEGGGDPASDDGLSPVIIRVPGSLVESDDDPATTPEASTDSENDSSFESDTSDEARSTSRKKVASR